VIGLWARILADVPVDVTAPDARDAANRELANPAYHAAQPSVVGRVLAWLYNHIVDLLDAAAGALPGGKEGLIALALLLLVIVIAMRWRVGALRRVHRSSPVGLDTPSQSAAELRKAADEALARGDRAQAVLQRFRAITRGLEERGVLEERAGRTVDEVAAEAGARLPEHGAGLGAAARTFDDVVYGGRTATDEDYQHLVRIDTVIAAKREALR
jgi:hypothetical protein